MATVIAGGDAVDRATVVDDGHRARSMTAQEMADMHEAGRRRRSSPATRRHPGQPAPEAEDDDGVKVFNLTASQVKWEVSKGQFVDAMAFNGQIPGRRSTVSYGRPRPDRRGEPARPADRPPLPRDDGAQRAWTACPYITQDPIMPGQVWTYEFTVQGPAGDVRLPLALQLHRAGGRGLYGALIVQPQGGHWPYPALSVDDRDGAITSARP